MAGNWLYANDFLQTLSEGYSEISYSYAGNTCVSYNIKTENIHHSPRVHRQYNFDSKFTCFTKQNAFFFLRQNI